jgi:hypothetical protein
VTSASLLTSVAKIASNPAPSASRALQPVPGMTPSPSRSAIPFLLSRVTVQKLMTTCPGAVADISSLRGYGVVQGVQVHRRDYRGSSRVWPKIIRCPT